MGYATMPPRRPSAKQRNRDSIPIQDFVLRLRRVTADVPLPKYMRRSAAADLPWMSKRPLQVHWKRGGARLPPLMFPRDDGLTAA